ncbi:MAG: DinB family protein [Chloroflexi bacterium]|nr:DinB family protein [Chloroflexota bacterium]
MNATHVLQQQLVNTYANVNDVVSQIRDGEWLRHPYPGAPSLGFTAWHIAATADWALNVWVQDGRELRASLDLPGINPAMPPFGMTAEAADAIAEGTSRDAVLEYARVAYDAWAAWLDGIADSDLDRVPGVPPHALLLPQHRVPGYVEELESMAGYSVARIVISPCNGHVRGHLGEIAMALSVFRGRGI